MSIKMILFDLDGTLLPMDQDVFVNNYFALLAKKLAPHGYEPNQLVKTVWKGTGAMMKNTGKKTNEEVFWDFFASLYGEGSRKDLPLFEEFYENEFDGAKDDCGYNPKAVEAVAKIKEMGYRVALATNPLFPAIATRKRINWAGFRPEDFEYYTTYETDHYCKPNPDYYLDFIAHLDVVPEECLMVGNDVGDDMVAEKIGMKVFLLTDCLINKEEVDISVYPNGGFDDLVEFVEGLR